MPLAGEHLEDAQNVLALAEAVEEHRHRADVERVRAQPHQVAVDARQLASAARASTAPWAASPMPSSFSTARQ